MTKTDWMVAPRPDPKRLRLALKPWTKTRRHAGISGDWQFALGLAQALNRLGHDARIDPIDAWDRLDDPPDLDVALRGTPYKPKPGVPLLIWAMYPARMRHDIRAEFATAAHVFFASMPDHARYRRHPDLKSCSFTPQAFDAARMYPGTDPRQGIVFVGSNYLKSQDQRPVVDWALAARVDFGLWGRFWADTPAAPHLVADFLPNERLGDLYRAAEIVLCDHRPTMAAHGYVSNRVFDALACAAPVISDPVAGLPPEFAPFVEIVDGPESLRAAILRIRSEGPEKRAERLAFARGMIGRHDFDARAAEIVATARRVL